MFEIERVVTNIQHRVTGWSLMAAYIHAHIYVGTSIFVGSQLSYYKYYATFLQNQFGGNL